MMTNPANPIHATQVKLLTIAITISAISVSSQWLGDFVRKKAK